MIIKDQGSLVGDEIIFNNTDKYEYTAIVYNF